MYQDHYEIKPGMDAIEILRYKDGGVHPVRVPVAEVLKVEAEKATAEKKANAKK